MKPLPEIVDHVSEITRMFDGAFSMKSASGKYIFVNDHWLRGLRMERDQVMGKTDAEIFPSAASERALNTDQQALRERIPIEYENRVEINGRTISYIAIKWAFFLPHGLPFCICTIADEMENKNKVLAMKDKVDSFFTEAAVNS